MSTAPATGDGSGTLPVGRRWRFGAAVLDERSLELRVADQLVTLERKPLEVLIYLLHHAGEVVTKDELLSNIWPGRVLSETVLTGNVSVLRHALQDSDHKLIKTVHGFGYRLDADVKVEATTAPPPPVFSFKVGDHPPLREHWKLVERLGTGGHGEAWLARHDKTGDARVFKFALNAGSLDSLKREITLYRVMHSSLGDKARVAQILEWNSDTAPYFLEIEYVSGRDLRTWVEARGGLLQIPLAERLEVVAQIADAVAGAHSVGVLHKDLKPGNVLVEADTAPAKIQLCDFGSGVIDPGRLEELGITKLGFTKAGASVGGTLTYLSPELVAGQPATVKGDVYALGVILYQVVAGSFDKPVAPGWEHDVADELLKLDIAAAAAGDPNRRLASATDLAERLRNLNERHAQRATERAAQERAERVRQLAGDLTRMRLVATAMLALGLTATVTSVVAFRAKNEALAASEVAKSVSDFLMEDVLRIDRQVDRPKEANYESTLDRAATQVSARFASHPEAAARVHWLLGRRFHEIGQASKALREYERAEILFSTVEGSSGSSTLKARERRATLLIDRGDVGEGLLLVQDLHSFWAGRVDLVALLWRTRLARLFATLSHYQVAEPELRRTLEALDRLQASDARATDDAVERLQEWLGVSANSAQDTRDLVTAQANELMSIVLGEVKGQYAEAEGHARSALVAYRRILGDNSELTAFAQTRLGAVLAWSGKYEEAEANLIRARDFYDAWLPVDHYHRGTPRYFLGVVRLEQGQPDDAMALFREAQRTCATDGCPARFRASHLEWIGQAYHAMGRAEDALTTLRLALHVYKEGGGTGDLDVIGLRVAIADSLRTLGRFSQAAAEIDGIDQAALQGNSHHPTITELRRVAGLLAFERGNFQQAQEKLQAALASSEQTLGGMHWRTRRIRGELDRVLRVGKKGATSST